MNKYRILVLLICFAFLLDACSPTVKVEAPDKPIDVNMNVNIKHKIKVKQIDTDTKRDVKEKAAERQEQGHT